MVRCVHGRVKLCKPEQTNRDQTHIADNEQSSRWKPRQQRHRHQHHQKEAARFSQRQSDQNVRGVDLLEHLVNEEKSEENDYENPFY